MPGRRSRLGGFGSVAVGGALFVATASSGWAEPDAERDVDARFEQMDQRIEQLEQRLEATTDELHQANARVDSQNELIERAGIHPASGDRIGLSRFLRETAFSGWVATSFWWNFNEPENGRGSGFNRGNPSLGRTPGGLGFPFHPDHDTFQVDQVWFAMHKRSTEESRAGFGIDLVFGKTADVLRDATPSRADLSAVYQAYVDYLAPIGPGVRITAGRFETHLGVESARSVYSHNATRGLVYSQLQPITHTGLKAETRLGPVRIMLGVANDAIADPDTDTDEDKALLWSLGLAVTEALELSVGGVYGGDGLLPGRSTSTPPGTGAGRNTDKLGIVDVVLRWDPSDLLSVWLNADYVWSEHEDGTANGPGATVRVPGNPYALGVALGSRYAIDDATGFALRAEWIRGEDNFLDPFATTGVADHTLYSLTGTLDHALTPYLRVRVEGRYEVGETDGSDQEFFRNRNPARFQDDQFVAGVEAVYRF